MICPGFINDNIKIKISKKEGYGDPGSLHAIDYTSSSAETPISPVYHPSSDIFISQSGGCHNRN
jgi:hypothetical protein